MTQRLQRRGIISTGREVVGKNCEHKKNKNEIKAGARKRSLNGAQREATQNHFGGEGKKRNSYKQEHGALHLYK